MKKKMLNVPPEEDLNDELRSHYDIDYGKTRPNRFAGGQQIIVGAVPSGYRPPSPTASKRAARKPSANSSRSHKTVVAKRVYLYPRHIKILARVDKNFSAAVRRLVDNYKD